ncbi:hypothetical protein MBANPS3_010579, partial [Mucor bainieri]
FDNNKLRELPTYTGQNAAIRIARLSLLKHTIESVTITLGDNKNDTDAWKFIEQLEECKSLTYLSLQGFVKEMAELETILNRCPHLLTLTIQNFSLEDAMYHHQTLPKAKLNAWMNPHVKKQDQLKTLSMNTACRPELLEYLIYKYVNIKEVVISGGLWLASARQDLRTGNLGRILDAVADIRSVKLSLELPANTMLKDAALFTRERLENIRFEVEDINGIQEVLIKAEW